MPVDKLAMMHGARPSLSVFLPMYNEASYVEPMVTKVLSVLGRLADEYEVLIVDDGSTDGSERIADALASADLHVRVVHHPENMGYGAALRTGFANASKELVFYTDCDDPVDMNDLEHALALMTPGVDLVVGYRTDRHDTPRRWLYSKVYNLIMRWMFGVRVRDVNFSFKLIRRAALQRLSLRAGSTFIDGELLAEAARCGYQVVEMPVEYHPRQVGKSSFDGLDAAVYTLEEMLAYLYRKLVRRLSAPGGGMTGSSLGDRDLAAVPVRPLAWTQEERIREDWEQKDKPY